MNRRKFTLALLLFTLTAVAPAQLPGPLRERMLLPNGWWLSPHGQQAALDDFPVNASLSADQRHLAVLHSGQSSTEVWLISTQTKSVQQRVKLKDAWYGIKFAGNATGGEKLFVSGGNLNCVYSFALQGDTLVPRDTFRLETPSAKFLGAVAGIDAFENTLADVVRNDSTLRLINLKNGFTVNIRLDAMPYACAYLPDGRLLVSLWNAKSVSVFQGSHFKGNIPAGDHPTDICVSPDGATAYVTNSNENTVTVIDTKAMKPTATIVTSLYPDSPEGSTPNSSALTSDGNTLFVANADNNSLTVVNLANKAQPTPVGFIPVGWYPTKVLVANNRTVFVLNGKGNRSLANPHHEYIGGLLKGTLSYFPLPEAPLLDALTKKVYENTPYKPSHLKAAEVAAPNPIPQKVGDASPIKHVFYIIKENRTYDQVFGDLPQGNGDSSLALFGEAITPNHHKLAKEFVLFDNFSL
ncbi:MAG: beta-propeller fold lactonase family protein, partial [Ignavibacteriales bacterium]|nr:beta-propeller fold lactonase family protein [Ignavibacteriales bacterium]